MCCIFAYIFPKKALAGSDPGPPWADHHRSLELALKKYCLIKGVPIRERMGQGKRGEKVLEEALLEGHAALRPFGGTGVQRAILTVW